MFTIKFINGATYGEFASLREAYECMIRRCWETAVVSVKA